MSKCAPAQIALLVVIFVVATALAREEHSSPLARSVLVHGGDLFVVLMGEGSSSRFASACALIPELARDARGLAFQMTLGEAKEALTRAKNAMGRVREKAEEAIGSGIEVAEVGGTAFGFGCANGRWGGVAGQRSRRRLLRARGSGRGSRCAL